MATETAQSECEVLLAEDDSLNVKLILAVLGFTDCKVTVVHSGMTACKELEQHAFDIVLMDVNMPEMDGIEATQWVRAREAALGKSRALIVGMTAGAMPDQLQRCFDAGMDRVMVKPIDVSDLLRMVADACNRHGCPGRER